MKIAIGTSCFSKTWQTKEFTWDELVVRLSKFKDTGETMAEYDAMSKSEQGKVKDTGGFIGGELLGGERKAQNVVSRSLICLDADYADLGFVARVQEVAGWESIIYTTHGYRDNKPRYRWVIPLTEAIEPDKYPAVARKLAAMVGIDMFDDTTYQVHRLMYWPSCSVDGAGYSVQVQGERLNAEDVLLGYVNWKDASEWPVSSRVGKGLVARRKKLGDPREKTGAIGLFCRAYDIHSAIATFLSDVYEACSVGRGDRYTLVGGSAAGGLVVYDDGVHCYSNHATDPISGMVCNAFDLVRVHMFGGADEGLADGVPSNKSLSYVKMIDFARKDLGVKDLAVKERQANCESEFGDADWQRTLDVDKKMGVVPSLNNLYKILIHDEKLTGIAYNDFSERPEIKGDMPWTREHPFYTQWRDPDDSQLMMYLSLKYAPFPRTLMDTVLEKVSDDRAFHPVRDYLRGLPAWDGSGRVNGFLNKYLGAENTDLNQALFRKWLVGAISRIFTPGVKFDTAIVLQGEKGIGKSWLMRRLAKGWFTDNFNLKETRNKTGSEQVQGYWIVEMGELQGLKKAAEDEVKNFLSRNEDIYRSSYGRRTLAHPRQCVFVGSTNDATFLNDSTGDRRFWPIRTGLLKRQKVDSHNPSEYEVDQLWAEALAYHQKGEAIFLSPEQEAELDAIREEFYDDDPQLESIRSFVFTGVPLDWGDRTLTQRLEYLDRKEPEAELVGREYISVKEVWCECWGRVDSDLSRRDSFRINRILRRIKEVEPVATFKKKAGPYGAQKVFKIRKLKL